MGKTQPLKKDLEKDANLITKKKGLKIHPPKVSLKSRKSEEKSRLEVQIVKMQPLIVRSLESQPSEVEGVESQPPPTQTLLAQLPQALPAPTLEASVDVSTLGLSIAEKSVVPVDISSDVVTNAITSNRFAGLEMIEEDENEVVNIEEEESIEEVFAEELSDHRSDAIQNVLLPLVSGDCLGVDKYYDDGIIGKNSETEAIDDIERDVWSESDLDDSKTQDSVQGESSVPKKRGRKSKGERTRAQAGLVPWHSPRL
ncbi:OLC1v1036444C1 [Oldenlandia corymbosa var. corymbosa]|uniref:OLC1v1036444C1 n=1 Tax=Oldenlandia corymbosa var. corymbosa TaxID=529605 RepID=A0AAV1CV95_OLDCO|nr:OLC1v1036444C1 [Oldenlandia corymbosa var. corymbosa]